MPKKNKKFKEVIETNKLLTSVLVIIFYFAWPIIIQVFRDIFRIDASHSFLFDIICNVLLAAMLITIYHKDLKEYLKNFNKNKFKYIKTILLYFLITLVAIALTNSFVIDILKIDHIAENDSALFESFKAYPLLVAFMTVIYYPVVEEIVFEKTLKDVIKSKWLFIILSGVFFWYYNIAYIEGITYLTIVSSLCYFVGGFLRALAFHKTNNLYVPVAIKALYNLFVTIIS